jgi:hypothetical protein
MILEPIQTTLNLWYLCRKEIYGSDRQTFLMLWFLKPAFVYWLRGFDCFDALQVLLGVAQELLWVLKGGVCEHPILHLPFLILEILQLLMGDHTFPKTLYLVLPEAVSTL